MDYKSIGLVRRIDDLGRIAIPKELRKLINVTEGDAFEIFVTRDNEIILRKYLEGEES